MAEDPSFKMASSVSNKMAPEEVYDVVVVGAGLAGLMAAHCLLKKDPTINVMILEARDRVGGRTLTLPLKVKGGGVEPFDLGGQWVGPTQRHLLELLKELGLEIFPQNVSGIKVMQLGDHKVRTYSSVIPSFGSLWALVEFQLFIWKVERMVPKIPMDDPYSSEFAKELEGLTVTAFCEQNLRTRAAKEAVNVAINATFGTDANRMGALFFLAYANSAGGMMKLFEAKHSAQESRVKGGTQAISEELADLIGREKIVLCHAVTGLDQTTETGIVHVQYRSLKSDIAENSVRARKIIMAVPPNLISQLTWSPPLHPLKRHICDTLVMGHLYKFIVTYERAHWLEKGYSGEVVTNGGPVYHFAEEEVEHGDHRPCSSGPLCVCFDATTPAGSPAIVGFFAGRSAVEWQQRTKDERKAAVLHSLSEYFGPEMQECVHYEEKIWADDPWAGGCPVEFGPPGTTFALPYLRTPHESVHFAGTETATVWMGYMSGAVASGERAAWEVLSDLRPHLLTEEQKEQARETRKFRREPSSITSSEQLPWKTLAAAACAAAAAAAYCWQVYCWQV